MLPGMLDVTESQLWVPAHTGLPVRLTHMPPELVHPSFSVAIGMILYANRTRSNQVEENPSWRSRVRAAFAGSY
jgi:cell division protein FtsA